MNRRTSGSNTQVVLARYGSDDFEIVLEPGHRAAGSSGRLALVHSTTGVRLSLDLRFLDYVARRSRGEIAVQLSAFYSDRSERFKSALLTKAGPPETDTLHLLSSGQGKRLQPIQIDFADGRLEVL